MYVGSSRNGGISRVGLMRLLRSNGARAKLACDGGGQQRALDRSVIVKNIYYG